MSVEYRHLVYYKKIPAKLFWKLLFYARNIEEEDEEHALFSDYDDSFKMTYDSKGVEIYYMENILYKTYKTYLEG